MPTFDHRDFRNALGTFATGVTVVTTVEAGGRRIGMTANSFSAVSLSPPLVLWSVLREAHSAPAFLSAGHFAVNVLAADQIALSRHFSRASDDKFAGIATRAGLGGCPLVVDAAAVFECSIERTFPGGDHEVIVGRVERYEYTQRDPLVFCRGRYQRGVNAEDHPDRDADIAAAWGGLA